jgi:hypothetical protein
MIDHKGNYTKKQLEMRGEQKQETESIIKRHISKLIEKKVQANAE